MKCDHKVDFNDRCFDCVATGLQRAFEKQHKGHGHLKPNANGSKARCGGPALCKLCAIEVDCARHTDLLREYEKLARENESLRAYADCYGYLRSQDTDSNTGLAIADRLNKHQGYFLSGDDADQALKAAMKKGGEDEQANGE